GGRCSRPVNLVSLFSTLTELSGLPPQGSQEPSLVPLLKDPSANWPHASITYHHDPGTYGISGEGWRYIHYADGSEELYDIGADPYEWENLVGKAEHEKKLIEMRAKAPSKLAKKVIADESLPKLEFQVGAGPASKPDGSKFSVLFINKTGKPVELFWNDLKGKPVSYGMIGPGEKRKQQTRPGAVWQLKIEGEGEARGHAVVGDRAARVIVR
ncbi:MAG: hypothetical protein ACI9NC_005170, partial [Verrucomicrobiales bacterium]